MCCHLKKYVKYLVLFDKKKDSTLKNFIYFPLFKKCSKKQCYNSFLVPFALERKLKVCIFLNRFLLL